MVFIEPENDQKTTNCSKLVSIKLDYKDSLSAEYNSQAYVFMDDNNKIILSNGSKINKKEYIRLTNKTT